MHFLRTCNSRTRGSATGARKGPSRDCDICRLRRSSSTRTEFVAVEQQPGPHERYIFSNGANVRLRCAAATVPAKAESGNQRARVVHVVALSRLWIAEHKLPLQAR